MKVFDRTVIAAVLTAAVVSGCRSHQASTPVAPAVPASTSTTAASGSTDALKFVNGVPEGYSLAWADEFHGPAGSKPDPKVWRYDLGHGSNGWGNGELENYVDDTAHCHIVPDSSATDGSALQITATKGSGKDYASVRLNTYRTLAFQYGYMEARIKAPAGKGIWPGFWFLGTDIVAHGWPDCGVISAMDVRGDKLGVNHASITGPGFSDPRLETLHTLPKGSFDDGYHTFAVDWRPQQMTFYVDDVAYATETPDTTPQRYWPFEKPFYMLLSLAVGGKIAGAPDASTPFPARMLVDYVRVYKAPGEGLAAFDGPHNLPGVVECEDFDNGGEGVGYHSNDDVNHAGFYRPGEGIDIEKVTGANAGYAIGWTDTGQWLKYSVDVQKTAVYKVGFRVCSGRNGGTFHLEDETGKNLTGPVKLGSTGGWQNWVTVTSTARLSAGSHVLRLVEDTGGYNVDYMAFS